MYTRQATPESQGCGSYSTSAETDPKPYTASNKTEVPQSVKGAPEHLRASIRKRQNSQVSRKSIKLASLLDDDDIYLPQLTRIYLQYIVQFSLRRELEREEKQQRKSSVSALKFSVDV